MWYCNPGQTLMEGKVMSSRIQPAIDILLGRSCNQNALWISIFRPMKFDQRSLFYTGQLIFEKCLIDEDVKNKRLNA